MHPGGEHARRKATTNLLLFGSLYSFELCVLLLLLTLYRLASKPTWLSFLSSLSGVLMVGTVMGLVGSAAIIVHQCYRSRHTKRQNCLLRVGMNIVSVLLVIFCRRNDCSPLLSSPPFYSSHLYGGYFRKRSVTPSVLG